MIHRITPLKGRWAVRGLAWIAVLTALSLAAVLAVHDIGVFELDGNALNAETAGDDWNSLFPTDTSPNEVAKVFTADGNDPPVDTTYFTGGGSKDIQDISQWMHTTIDQAPDKDEISNAYAAAYVNGDLLIYFGADRFANNGDSQIGFWFFQNPIGLNLNGTFSGVHAVGDLLVLSDFTKGGKVSTIRVFKWVGSGGSDGPIDLLGSGVDCSVSSSGDFVCATVNTSNTSAPWPYTPKFGSPNIFPAKGSFYEGGLSVSDLLGDVPCFSSFLAETRSSQSVSAQLKDFALGQFALCDAKISITPSVTNEVRTNHVLTVTVEKKDASTNFLFGPASGVTATASLTNSDGATAAFVGGNTCVTAGNGTCTVTINSPTAGITTVSASANITLSDGTVLARSTNGQAGNSGPATKRWVDAQIDLSPLTDTNEVEEQHTVTATVQQDDGLAAGGDGVSGFGPAPDGTLVTFSLLNNSAGASFVGAIDTCTTVGGTCPVQINTSTAGSVDIHATTTFSVGGVSLTRATGTGFLNSADANKVYVDATIAIAPNDTNEVGQPHTFTVTVLKNAGDGAGFVAASGVAVTVTLTDANGAVAMVSSNTCPAGTNGSGQCTVTFSSSTAGTVTGHASADILVGGLTLHRETDGVAPNSGDAVKRYVDARISIEPDDTNSIKESHTFTVKVLKNAGLGAGFVNASGVVVTVTLTPAGGAAAMVSSDTCVGPGGTNGSGQCNVIFTSNSAGSITGHASANILINGVTVHRETNGLAGNSGDAVKIFVAGSLRWLKQRSTGTALGGATFEVCRTDNFVSATMSFQDIEDVCVNVRDNNAPDADPDAGEFQLNNLVLGRYTIEETNPPPGFVGDLFVETVDLTIASANLTAVHVWVNRPAEGCTPGFWKNHPELWDGVSPDVTTTIQTTDLFNATFGVTSAQSGLADGVTVFDALSVSGSDLMALNRHAAAGLVSADSGIAYEFTLAEIIALYRDAVGAVGGPETVASALAKLEAANNRLCPLN